MNEINFSDRLLPNEKVMWTGKPNSGLVFTKRDAVMIPFSMLWLSFAIFWTTSVSSISTKTSSPNTSIPSFMILWGGMFVCIGLYFVFGRFLFDAFLRRNMSYAVTDQRILILRTGLFSVFRAISLNTLPETNLSKRANGSGTILFGQSLASGYRGFGAWSPALDPTPQFIAIPEAQQVFDLIQRLKAASK